MQTKIINPRTGEIAYSFESVIKDPGHLVATVDTLAEYEKTLHLDSSWSNAYFMMGKILEEKARKAEALSRYKRFLELDSTSANAALAKKRMQSMRY